MGSFSFEKHRNEHDELAAPLTRVLDPVSLVSSVIARASKVSAQKLGLDVEDFIVRLKQHDSLACAYCRYNIARELGEALGIWNKNLKAVYTCNYDEAAAGEDCFEAVSMSALIHLIIWAEQKTKALSALIESIDRAMVQHYRDMLGFDRLENVLDVQVIDDEDVRNCRGYAALLRSINQPAIRVWQSGTDIQSFI